ncbi:two-component system response regulator protein-glutamate methylesterase [Pseudolabrys sp. Root1462]|uniref:chemotaxis-specific protein-glutamate methyltransferase CheB n=1 Tax=Pseudolabrys sp. Root1462 TaxID=1736466 RepID=UPI0007030DB1|nr:chemotaxis-specific protein-glutamate methyltransferase CheB [Pseudolabrys sp. Root1462]KQZ01529.1 two-component system response regulator protein-glutamate methylesterase [Pseudolabrys sp. Root1462]
MIKLLIADDSALMRKLLQDIFVAEGDFDIRLARNGAEALDLVRSFDPQVITLDVQMPDMDGLTCLSQIMIEMPRPVVMVSSLTAEGAEETLEAIELGAVDFVAKPSGAVSLEIDRLRPVLVEKVRAASKARIRRTLRLTERVRHQMRSAVTARVRPKPARRRPVSGAGKPKQKPGPSALPGLVLIGSSTGGPAALDAVLPSLPGDFPWPVLVAQHLPASFTGPFARRLNSECQLSVVEVGNPMPLQAGTIYIARGDADVVVAARATGIIAMPAPARASYLWHPSVERMVLSALECIDAERMLGVMLTGMGNDGAAAMKKLSEGGGRTIAEAESTAVVWGMPGELVKNGGAGLVRPVDDIAEAIVELVGAHASH